MGAVHATGAQSWMCRKDGLGKEVVLLCAPHAAIQHDVGGKPAENYRVKEQGGEVMAGVCWGPPAQDEEVDEAFKPPRG